VNNRILPGGKPRRPGRKGESGRIVNPRVSLPSTNGTETTVSAGLSLICRITANRAGRNHFRKECERLGIVASPVQFRREVPAFIPEGKDLWDFLPLSIMVSALDDGPILDLLDAIHGNTDVQITDVTHPLSASVPSPIYSSAEGAGNAEIAGCKRVLRERKQHPDERRADIFRAATEEDERQRKASRTPFQVQFEDIKSGRYGERKAREEQRKEEKRIAALPPEDREREQRQAERFKLRQRMNAERSILQSCGRAEPHESEWADVWEDYSDVDIFGQRRERR
jgi:hypothetical protein